MKNNIIRGLHATLMLTGATLIWFNLLAWLIAVIAGYLALAMFIEVDD
jgi:predicted membrane protein